MVHNFFFRGYEISLYEKEQKHSLKHLILCSIVTQKLQQVWNDMRMSKQ